MSNKKPVFWYQGLFLQPQHFQQFDQYVQSLLTPLQSYLHPYFQGVINLEIQLDNLRNNVFEVSQGEFIFPDGTWVNVPGNAIVSPRSIDSNILPSGKTAKIYLGLHTMSRNGSNVKELQTADDLQHGGTRFITSVDPAEVRDIHQSEASAPVKLMEYAPKLFLEEEIADLTDYSLIPVAALTQEDNGLNLSSQYIPPSVTLGNSRELLHIVHSIRDQVTSWCRKLEEYKSPEGVRTTALDQTYLAYLLALRSLTRYTPLLHHITAEEQIHPWNVYGLLRTIIGELSTYTDRIDALGRLRNGNELVPPYDHENLWYCFNEVRTLLGELLESIVIGPEKIIHMERENGSFTAHIPAELYESSHTFFLIISTSEKPETVLKAVDRIAKVSSSEHMQILIARALPGIALIHNPVPPPGMPTHPNSVYFEIDQTHQQWQEIKKNRTVCLYWSNAPKDIRADVTVLKK